MRYLFIPLALAMLLSACGYKGPLYLPTQGAQTQHKQDASQP
jgi:predicted small lipoprotein YifL